MREQSTEKIPNYFAQKLQKKFDESTLAIVLYGSWLRGKRDTVVDLYVIVDNYRYLDSTVDKILTNFFSPNVYQQVGEHLAGDFRVKFEYVLDGPATILALQMKDTSEKDISKK